MHRQSDKIFSLTNIKDLTDILSQKKQSVVVAGGCFDLLHVGHITFLQEAKKQGDILIILLEADETIKKNKGEKRPINTQLDRAKILSAIQYVDYICLLEPHMTDKDYDRLVFMIKPAIISTTKGDLLRFHKERQAREIGAIVKDVTEHISEKSTTALFHLLDKEIL